MAVIQFDEGVQLMVVDLLAFLTDEYMDHCADREVKTVPSMMLSNFAVSHPSLREGDAQGLNSYVRKRILELSKGGVIGRYDL